MGYHRALLVGLVALAACTKAVEPEPEPAAPKTEPARPPVSRWDPPADLPHLESTPPELRARIDDRVAVLLDPMAGRDSLAAREELVAIGKPAFPRILGGMAGVRDRITDDDNMDERLRESSLMIADQALRQMDGYLDRMQKSVIRPGSDRKYITYILRLHYKRWTQVLSELDTLPGPYAPDQG